MIVVGEHTLPSLPELVEALQHAAVSTERRWDFIDTRLDEFLVFYDGRLPACA